MVSRGGSYGYDNPPEPPSFRGIDAYRMFFQQDIPDGDLTGSTSDTFNDKATKSIKSGGLEQDQMAEILGWELEHHLVSILPEGSAGTTPGRAQSTMAVVLAENDSEGTTTDGHTDFKRENGSEGELINSKAHGYQGFNDTTNGTGGLGNASGQRQGPRQFWYRDFLKHGPVITDQSDSLTLYADLVVSQVDNEDVQARFAAKLFTNIYDVDL